MKIFQATLISLFLAECISVAVEKSITPGAKVAGGGDLSKMPYDAKTRMYDFLGPNKFLSAAVSQQNRADYLNYSKGNTTTAINSEAVATISVAEYHMDNGIDRLKLLQLAIKSDNLVVATHFLLSNEKTGAEKRWNDYYSAWIIRERRDDPCLEAISSDMVMLLRENGFCYDDNLAIIVNTQNAIEGVKTLNLLKDKRFSINYQAVTKKAFEKDNSIIVDWVVKNSNNLRNGYTWQLDCIFAAKTGRKDVLKWIVEENHGLCSGNTYNAAVEHDHLELLDVLTEYKVPLPRWTSIICHSALKKGSIEALEWMYSHRITCESEIYVLSVQFNHNEVIRWAEERGIPLGLTDRSCFAAVEFNAIDALEWFRARNHHCEYSELIENSILYGQIDILNWAEITYPGQPFPLVDGESRAAAKKGYLDVLQWTDARLVGADWNHDKKQKWYNTLASLKPDDGRVEVIEWAVGEIDAPEQSIKGAARMGSNSAQKFYDNLVKWAYNAGAIADSEIIVNLATNDRHEVWKWIIDREPSIMIDIGTDLQKLSDFSCVAAAQHLRFSVLNHIVTTPQLRVGCLEAVLNMQDVYRVVSEWVLFRYKQFGLGTPTTTWTILPGD